MFEIEIGVRVVMIAFVLWYLALMLLIVFNQEFEKHEERKGRYGKNT